MGRSLVIVESPAKAKTINKYLGRNYSVKASYGHIMDLPRKVLGIDIAHGFEPTYEVSPAKTDVVRALQKAASTADAVYLAGDPDREGEAICAHLAEVLSGPKLEFPEEGEEEKKEEGNETGKNGKKKAKKPARKAVAKGKPVIARKNIFRVMFNEITSKAIKAAFEHPGEIDENLVDAQQARRVLDRLVGYKISPLLWDKVRRGLSAGRVQTVALRLIVDREVTIRAFNPAEYWTIHAALAAGEPPVFEAKLTKYKDEDIDVHTQAEADAIVAATKGVPWKAASVTQKEKRRFAPPPFTTSKLQQAAYNRLRYTAKRTMALAQRLYEGVELGQEGSVALITYMRTDSVRVSNDALDQVRGLIASSFGPAYLPEKPNYFKSKKDAQDAHEAVRPTDAARTPAEVKPFLSEDLFKLYQLIWQRFVASQMVPAVFDQTTIDIEAGDYTFRATGSVQKFDGYLTVYQVATGDDEDAEPDSKALLPPVAEGETLRLETLRPEQHFTEPPPRYTEATLVKELEEKGIGRPSTYASIISTIVDREYVTKDQGRFAPTMLGEKVSVLLVKSFEDIFDVGFTARMEEELDEIEEGKMPWRRAVKEFYGPFAQDLKQAKGRMESYKAGIPTGQKCEKCGQGELLERISRHGFFLGCSRYPDCDFIRDLSPELPSEGADGEPKTEYCDNCGREMVIKRGRWGAFLACTGYPDCKTTRRLKAGTRRALQPDELLDEKCPDCGSQLVKKHGQYGEFTGCTAYPKCKFIRSKTLGIKCLKCETGELVERVAKKGRRRVFYGCNQYPKCDFTTPHLPIAEPCPKCGAPFIVEKRSKMGSVRACLKEGCDWEAATPDSPATLATPEPVGSLKA
jgi:DNA topoisomerase-1